MGIFLQARLILVGIQVKNKIYLCKIYSWLFVLLQTRITFGLNSGFNQCPSPPFQPESFLLAQYPDIIQQQEKS